MKLRELIDFFKTRSKQGSRAGDVEGGNRAEGLTDWDIADGYTLDDLIPDIIKAPKD